MIFLYLAGLLASLAIVCIIVGPFLFPKKCAGIFKGFTMFTGFLCFLWVMAITTPWLMPYFAFGFRKVINEDITLVRWHQRIVEFSNGETAHTGELFWLFIYLLFIFVVVTGSIGLLMHKGLLFITGKISPAWCQYLNNRCDKKTKDDQNNKTGNRYNGAAD